MSPSMKLDARWMSRMTLWIAVCGGAACSKASETKSEPAPAAKSAYSAKPVDSAEAGHAREAEAPGGPVAGVLHRFLDYWSVGKRATKLSRDPSGYYTYSMMIRAAREVPATEAELSAKATDGKLEKRTKFFSVEKTAAVPGGLSVIGMRGQADQDASKADKGFFVVRDLGGGVKIECTPSDTNPGSNDEIIAEAIATCAAATL